MQIVATVIAVFVSVALVCLAIWAFVLLRSGKPASPDVAIEGEWRKTLEGVRRGHGVVESTATLYAADLQAVSIAKLSDEIRQFNLSTERLGKANLLLACIIASATLAYTVATWLIVQRR